MYSQEFINYLVHFHGDRDYFECHEILEEYWKKVDKKNKNSILVAFIQLAVSNYHHRRNNFSGALKTLEKAIQIFEQNREEIAKFGFLPSQLISFLQEQLYRIKQFYKYRSLDLPIADKKLNQLCIEACNQKGWKWCQISDLSNPALIHKHINRDRSDVIEERNRAREERQK